MTGSPRTAQTASLPRLPSFAGEMLETGRALLWLFDAPVVPRHAAPRLDDQGLYPEELAYVAQAVPKRRAEFATVRRCAREALAELCIPPIPFVPQELGAPRWPDGVIGTMSHGVDVCAAVVGRTLDVRSIGLDIEGSSPFDATLETSVCTLGERRACARFGVDHLAMVKLLFSAKEAFYKCQFPLTGKILDFLDVEIELDVEEASFRVVGVAHSEVPEAIWKPMVGRFAYGDGRVFTAVTCRA